MINDEIMEHYDYLMRLAASKCHSQTDAEDLVGETMLAAFAYIQKGGTIEHPKTWLANTLYHKHNDHLRKLYRRPMTVCLDEVINIASEEQDEDVTLEEASKVRKELNHLAYITREVLIRFYFGNQSVADIAKGLDIPKGTVKSRLAAGRSQMKKGLETMENQENYLPGRLSLSFGGCDGLKGEPITLVWDDLIAQNLLILAYEKPITISELSKAIGIPAAYIEPIIRKLVDGELMVQMESGKVYTDFIIFKPQDVLKSFKPQLEFAHAHFDTVWGVLAQMSKEMATLPFFAGLDLEKKTMLDRYAVLKALQDFQTFGTDQYDLPKFPRRKDGGQWTAQATMFEAGYDLTEYNEALQYVIHGGHRATESVSNPPNGPAKRIWFYEFDTTLYDHPRRFAEIYELYFKYIVPFLWHVYENKDLGQMDVPNDFIASIPILENAGLVGYADDRLCVKIPVIDRTSYNQLSAIIKAAHERIASLIGKEYTSFIATMKTPIPKHLTSVPKLFQYCQAGEYFAMAIVREAYDKGLHLQGVDYCCPPVVLVYEK